MASRGVKRVRTDPELCDTPRFGGDQPSNQHTTSPSILSKVGGLLFNRKDNEKRADTGGSLLVAPLSITVDEFDESTGKPAMSSLCNVASEVLGARIVFATDEFFGKSSNILKESEVSNPSESSCFGEIIDGWQTRRRRTLGHDWILVKLACPTFVKGIGLLMSKLVNPAPRLSVEAGRFADEGLEKAIEYHVKTFYPHLHNKELVSTHLGPSYPAELIQAVSSLLDNGRKWDEVIPMTRIRQGENHFAVETSSPHPITHIRINIFPDGGISRLQVWGEVQPDVMPLARISSSEEANEKRRLRNQDEKQSILRYVDFASALTGGWPLFCTCPPRDRSLSYLCYPEPAKTNCAYRNDIFRGQAQPLRPPMIFAGQGNSASFPGEENITFKLAERCRVFQVEINTVDCLGDAPARISVYGMDRMEIHKLPILHQMELFKTLLDGGDGAPLDWTPISLDVDILPDARNVICLQEEAEEPDSRQFNMIYPQVETKTHCFTHIRLHLIPDGAVARVRVYGTLP